MLVAATMLALQTALGLVFDPRYRDFAFAPLTAAAVPFVVAVAARPARSRARAAAPKPSPPSRLRGSAVYIVLNESFANWQALWFAAVLVRARRHSYRLRDAQST